MFALHPFHFHHSFHVPPQALRYFLAALAAAIVFFVLASPVRGWAYRDLGTRFCAGEPSVRRAP